jgi:outer membrane receptor for ferrienterochelin and colicins
MSQNHLHRFGKVVEDDRHSNLFGEVSLSDSNGRPRTINDDPVASDPMSGTIPQCPA